MIDNRLDLIEFLTDLAFCDFYIVTVLRIQPELSRGAKGLPATQRSICAAGVNAWTQILNGPSAAI